MKEPTPLELMAFHDGELDEARAREVRAWLAADREGAALLGGLRDLGRHVRTAAPRPAPPADLTDRIFAAIDAEAPSSPSEARLVPNHKPSGATPRDGLALVVPLRRQAAGAGRPPPAPSSSPAPPAPASAPAAHAQPRPSPTTRRALRWVSLSATGMSLAAAAAFVLWWVPGGGHGRLPGSAQPTAAIVPVGDAFGTDVDTVDFGARMGSIFFVSNDSQATPVLWIDDDDAESDDTP
jgi:hypothetical protein